MMEEQEKLAASTTAAFWEEAVAAVARPVQAERLRRFLLAGSEALLGGLLLPSSSFYGMESTVFLLSEN